MNFHFEIQRKKNNESLQSKSGNRSYQHSVRKRESILTSLTSFGNKLPEKKKVSMDVRVPARSLEGSAHASSRAQKSTGKFHFSYSPYSEAPAKRIDGLQTSFHAAYVKSEYAKRVSAMSQTSYQAKKFRTSRSPIAAFLGNLSEVLSEWKQSIHISLPGVTPNKLVYGSIMSGVAFGMVSLGLIEKTFDANATAESGNTQQVETVTMATENYKPDKDVFMQYFSDAADAEYQAGVREMVKGYPIEEMLPYIFEKDRVTAAFLIGIAKKESNWGKRRPVLDGQDCFNYWGYRGQRRLMGSGGHTCFNSRKDAVDTVAKRLETLINSERLNTPDKLIVWKCGMSCEGHSRESVAKWISDVDAYYSEMMALESENTELEEPAEGS